MEPQIRIQASAIFDRPSLVDESSRFKVDTIRNFSSFSRLPLHCEISSQNRVKIVSNVTVSSDHEPVMMVIKCLIRIRIIDHIHAWHSPSNELLSARSAFLFEARAIVRMFEGIVRGFFSNEGKGGVRRRIWEIWRGKKRS